MSDSFVNLPLDKLKNRENIVSRVERLEGKTGARPSATAVSLGEIAGQTGTLSVDGSIVVMNRADGIADVTINDAGIFFRNQEGTVGFVPSGGVDAGAVEIYISGDDYLEFFNNINSKGFAFLYYDSGGGSIETVINESGIRVSAGSITASAGNVVVDSPGYDLLYGSLAAHEGFFPVSETWTRTGTHSFTVPSNLESRYRKGTKLAYTDAGVSEYGVVGSSVFVTTDNATTVTLIPNTDYSMSTDTIADPYVSYIDNPIGFPDWFNFDAAPSGFSAVPASPSYRWRTSGKCIFISYVELSNGTSNATTFTATGPIAPVQGVAAVAGTLVDNGTLRTVAGRVTMSAGSAAIAFRTDMASGAWTNANGKRAVAEWYYEF
jgi:hypothetical protein